MDIDEIERRYVSARNIFIENPDILISLERYITEALRKILEEGADEIKYDYNQASSLYPFWKNYPPLDRGRSPRGDQYPWIEVGEHAVGNWIIMNLDNDFTVNNPSFPTGPDQRILISGPGIRSASRGLTDCAWLMIDIKSVGPRDDFDHAVMSRNQVSGSGEWDRKSGGIINSPVVAKGKRKIDEFYPSLPPVVVTENGSAIPVITLVVKPVYSMPSLSRGAVKWSGQPLKRIDIATIPNGILLSCNPRYAESHEGIFYPGKDDKSVPQNRRARVDFRILRQIASWRHGTIVKF